jgi:hypothetical protein
MEMDRLDRVDAGPAAFLPALHRRKGCGTLPPEADPGATTMRMRRTEIVPTLLFAVLTSFLLAASGCTGGISIRYPTFPDETCPSCDRAPL